MNPDAAKVRTNAPAQRAETPSDCLHGIVSLHSAFLSSARLFFAAVALVLARGEGLAQTAPAPAATALAASARVELTGDWRGGSLAGHAPGRGTLYSGSKDAAATWFPAIMNACPVRISFWVSPHERNTPAARVEVSRGRTSLATRIVDLSAEPARWEPLGVFTFDGAGRESIRVFRTGSGTLRVSALKLDVLDPRDHDLVWQTLILDDFATYDPTTLAYHAFVCKDVPESDPLAPIVARLGAEGVLPPVSPGVFAPERIITRAEFSAALGRVLGSAPATEPAASLGSRFDTSAALRLLARAAVKSGRPLDWAHAPQDPSDDHAWALALGLDQGPADPLRLSANSPLTRARAALLLERFQARITRAGPPGSGWSLAFQDEFDAPALNRAVWSVSNRQSWGKLLSIRMTPNVVQQDGLLRLFTRREKVGDFEWTTGMVGTNKGFRQAYGYWEARMRYAPAPGLNNAFWINPGKGAAGEPGWEIDMNEGHWPNTLNASLHQDGLASLSKAWRAPMDLGRDFHIYACLWDEKEIVYYWDGREISRKPNTHAQRPGPVIFSTAVLAWAGTAGASLADSSMDVDWVRVWRRTDSVSEPRP
ncbi:MAG: family 16 glycosylhydrolase [Opitutaceae bacterium]|nr:family 16 glycosylhydrolase [Opitutaceae bacterium]